MNTQTHKCTCGAEIGRKEEDQCYFVQAKRWWGWEDCNKSPMTHSVCELWLKGVMNKRNYRIVRRTDELVNEYGEGEE